uniref:Uncharacterized protein n=1 Tax=Rhodnius prolixus TaxID=13249 RepID=T1IEP3_RHOPR
MIFLESKKYWCSLEVSEEESILCGRKSQILDFSITYINVTLLALFVIFNMRTVDNIANGISIPFFNSLYTDASF